MQTVDAEVIFFSAGYLIADEFPGELAAGAAYVAGHDVEGRPVLVMLDYCSFESSGSAISTCNVFTKVWN